MRIAYVTPYQGPTLLKRRPIVRNRSMSNRIKIELIATLLRASSHDVEIISQGEVVDSAFTFYPAFSEEERFYHDIPIYYGSVLPIRRLNGLWSNASVLHILKTRHRANPYDLVIVFNLKGPQIACATYAIRQLGLPVILEYEDDKFVNVEGKKLRGVAFQRDVRACKRLFEEVSGCIAVSPPLLSQLPARIPSLLLRGVVGRDLFEAARDHQGERRNRVMFSGTHIASNGVAELIEAWRNIGLPDWELHITGHGELNDALRRMAADVRGIVFHGLVERSELIGLMTSVKICMNPHQLSQVPGSVFAFKIIEYLAAGAHVVTTPMGPLEKELEAGITYMPDNSPATIRATIRRVIDGRGYTRTATEAARSLFGPPAVSKSLDILLQQVKKKRLNPT